MAIANCAKCNKLFHRKDSVICQECQQTALNNISTVYRYLQEHPPQTLEAVAKKCSLPIKDLECMLSSGKLGTAAHNIIFHCQSCNRIISALQRKGHFCPECAGRIETKAGLSEKEVSMERSATAPIPLCEQRDKKQKNQSVEAALESATLREEKWPDASVSNEEVSIKSESISPLGGTYGFKRTSE